MVLGHWAVEKQLGSREDEQLDSSKDKQLSSSEELCQQKPCFFLGDLMVIPGKDMVKHCA